MYVPRTLDDRAKLAISYRLSGDSQIDAYCKAYGLKKDKIELSKISRFFNADSVKHKMYELEKINSITVTHAQLLQEYMSLYKDSRKKYTDDKGNTKMVDAGAARCCLDSIAKHIGFFEIDNRQKGESEGVKLLRAWLEPKNITPAVEVKALKSGDTTGSADG